MSETAISTPDISELRARAAGLGYSKVDKHGDEYWLIGADGERCGVEGLGGLASHLDDVEAIRGGAVRAVTTACGTPTYAHDKDGEVPLDDARVVEALGAEGGTEKPDFDAMSDEELALHDHRVGNVGMNADQHKRLERAYAFFRKKAEGAEIFSPSRRRPAKETLSSQTIDDIHIPPGRRALDENTVVNLMRSIERLGLQSPPSIRFATVMIDGEECDSWPVLVAGRHRLEAMRRLGHMWITCVVLNISDVDAELTEISENLHRAELTVLQRDGQIARWIESTTIKPDISDDDAKPAQAAQVSGGRGKKGRLSEASRELGIERTDAIRAAKVAALSPEAKAAAVEAGLDDNRTALLEAAKETEPEKQVAVLKKRSRAKRATKAEQEAARESVAAALKIARQDAEKRKAAHEPVDDDDVGQANLRNILLMNIAAAIQAASYQGPVDDELVAKCGRVASAWLDLADELRTRLAGGDQQQAA
ncbi:MULTISPECIES: ParB/RepB/Spo0J family partition protein [unclassified Bradyrhizobium]|uniref:ParB/RepB/Spo0J family partition protein n=1 Tax=unclassified Bradyrhizobium TaxID=2631580 RepID=UPI0033993624